MKRLTEIRSGTPCIVLQQNTTDTWMLTEGKWKGSQAKFLYGEHAKVLRDVQDILRDDYDLDRLRELVKADREGRCVVLPCKVGDKIYTTHRCKDGRNFITEATVVGMHIKDEFCRGYIPRKEYVVCRCNGYSKHIPMDHIGKRAFFSFKAAEAALKGEQA